MLVASSNAVLLRDWRYWALNEDVLDKWLAETNTGVRTGMIVELTNESSLPMFQLKWS